MGTEAIIVLIVIVLAVILFVSELISVDLVAMLIVITLVLSGVISPSEGIAGFSNQATLTVAFMFVISAALLKTGAFQYIGLRLANVFRYNFRLGLFLMMILVGVISAFINNTPVVAVFIPVIVQIGHASGQSPAKMLMPLSFASIFGGMCSLIGTSTNVLVSGIAVENGLEGFGMFQMTPLGVVFLLIGILYMSFIGLHLLPKREGKSDLKEKFNMGEFLTEIEIMPQAMSVNRPIMDSPLVKELEMEIIQIRRGQDSFVLPPGDMVLQAHDILKVRCSVDKLRLLKDRVEIQEQSNVRIGDHNLQGRNSVMVEFVITANSDYEGKTLKEVDFRRQYRAAPLAIRHREEIVNDNLLDVPLKSGDVILAEVKRHFVQALKARENEQGSPFILLSTQFNLHIHRRKLLLSTLIVTGVVLSASMGWLPIMMASLIGVVSLVLTQVLKMKEVYAAINWNIVFLLAGALSLGVAMQNSGLSVIIADFLSGSLGQWGPMAVVSGLYLSTMLITEVMSNNATAALLAPIAIAISQSMGLSPTPFLMAVAFAASASLLTPVGYQTNTMIYSAGEYRFFDFFRVGGALSLLFWVLATLLIPYFFPF
ncbi:MAG: SLC13 family permease [Bacteroidota bacterium]